MFVCAKHWINMFEILFSGYGHIAPTTNWGKVACIGYSVVGIPLFLLTMGKLGKLFTKGLKHLWSWIRQFYNIKRFRLMRQTRRMRVDSKEKTKTANESFDIQTTYHMDDLDDLKKRKQAVVVESDVTSYNIIKTHQNESENDLDSSIVLKPHDNDSMEIVFKSNKSASEKENDNNGSQNDLKSFSVTSLNKPVNQDTHSIGSYKHYTVDDNYDLPLWVSIIIWAVYILLGAGMYSTWETNWSYLDAVYFVFMSLSTIGLGDFVPTHNYLFLMTSIYILFGLALIAELINILLQFLARK